MTQFHFPLVQRAPTTDHNWELHPFIGTTTSFKLLWKAVFPQPTYLLDEQVTVRSIISYYSAFFLTRGKKTGETVVLRRELRVFKPNIWPPTSRMEWRGCSFFRGRKQWMLLEGWGPEQGPAWVTDMWMSGSALLFKWDLWERGQGDLWGYLSSIKMFELLVAHETKCPHNFRLLQVFLFRRSDSPGGFQPSLILLIFFKGWSKTPLSVATHSFHPPLSVRTLCSTPLSETSSQSV